MEKPLVKNVTLSAFVAAYYWEPTGSGLPFYNTQQFLVGKETSTAKKGQWSFGGGNNVSYFSLSLHTLLLYYFGFTLLVTTQVPTTLPLLSFTTVTFLFFSFHYQSAISYQSRYHWVCSLDGVLNIILQFVHHVTS